MNIKALIEDVKTLDALDESAKSDALEIADWVEAIRNKDYSYSVADFQNVFMLAKNWMASGRVERAWDFIEGFLEDYED
ncbi:hypothetical protein IKF15_00285 [Candidatus Saccharibacteria bacterium]|nr:hypothetical protein [Candidatus Saccharibacteria bacterium]